jgi:hypothetical protein
MSDATAFLWRAELAGYPSQALFQREADMPGSDYKKLLTEEERNDQGKFR